MPHLPADRPPTYLYRSTEDKLEEHLPRIAEAGDTVEHIIFKGGRDYVLVVRRGADDTAPTVRLDDDTVHRLAAAVRDLDRRVDRVRDAARQGARQGQR